MATIRAWFLCCGHAFPIVPPLFFSPVLITYCFQLLRDSCYYNANSLSFIEWISTSSHLKDGGTRWPCRLPLVPRWPCRLPLVPLQNKHLWPEYRNEIVCLNHSWIYLETLKEICMRNLISCGRNSLEGAEFSTQLSLSWGSDPLIGIKAVT